MSESGARSFTRGVLWVAISQAVRLGSQIVGIAVFARFLPAEDFGVLALAALFTGFALLFRDLGTGAAVIQKKDLTAGLLDAVFWLNVFFGAGLALLIAGASPLFAAFFSAPALAPVLVLSSLAIPISSTGIVHQALLERVSNFRPVALIEAVSALVGLSCGIVAVIAGLGIYAVVIQSLATSAVGAAGLWVASPWRPVLNPRFRGIGELWGFSGNLVGFNIFNYFARNADNILIGRVLGAVDLGYYNIAYRLMLWPTQNIATVVSRALYPTFSRMQDDRARIAAAYLRVTSAILLITAPMLLGLFAIRETFVLVVLGERWLQVAGILAWLLPIGVIQSISAPTGTVYLATGRADLIFRWGLFAGSCTVAAFVIGIQWGLTGLLAGYALVMTILLIPSLWIALRLIELPVIAVLRAAAPPLASAGIMAFVIRLVHQRLEDVAPSFLSFLLLVSLGGVIYTALAWSFQRKLISDVWHTLRRRPVNDSSSAGMP